MARRKLKLESGDVDEVLEPKHPTITCSELRGLLQNSRNAALLYDIETRPAEESVLKRHFQTLLDRGKIKLPSHPGEFDPTAVKYGNATRPEARQAKYRAAYEKHQQELNQFSKARKVAAEEAYADLVAGSTLCPLLGRVLAIGYGLKHDGKLFICLDIEDTDEAALLRRHWQLFRLAKKRAASIVSYNGAKFDYPFTYRRSLAYEDVQPLWLRTKYNKMEDCFVDAAERYAMGVWNSYMKLDDLCTLMGVGGKLEGMTGDQFWSVHLSDPKRARQYLEHDILALHGVARRMNLI
jgi:hypothetical protein